MQDTSLSTYYKEVKPKIGIKQRVVLVAFQMSSRPANNQEIADYLDQPINTITPRTNELVKLGKLELAFKAVYPVTNRRVCYWQIRK